MKKILLVAALLVLAGGPAWADTFVNGGFESGTWAGWTLGGGRYNGTYTYTGDPGKSAVVTPALDPYTGNNLQRVLDGGFSARVNNWDNGYHFTTLSQQVLDYTDPYIYFAWAGVVENPGHTEPGHVRVTLTNVTDNNTVLYNQQIDWYNHPGVVWHTNGNWGYTDWNLVTLDVSAHQHDTLLLTVLASDCGWGGHGGYAYFDGFGGTPPPVIPEPASMLLLGSGLVGLAARLRRRK